MRRRFWDLSDPGRTLGTTSDNECLFHQHRSILLAIILAEPVYRPQSLLVDNYPGDEDPADHRLNLPKDETGISH